MDKKQQISVPKYIWVIAAILVACIIFLIFVQTPFSQKFSGYETAHASATSQINQYNEYLAKADEVQASIDKMKKQYEEESEKLFVNVTKSSDDIRTMLQKLGYDLSTLSVQKGVPDAQGRASSTGDPLYSTVITYSFKVTRQKAIETLKYFESESNGAYYISNLSLTLVGDDEKTAKSEDMYNVSLVMNLYYFNPDAKVATPSAASGASSTSSAASSKA